MDRQKLNEKFKHLDKRNRDFLLSYAPPQILDAEEAQLKLEFLKENFAYLDFFNKFRSNPENYFTISFPKGSRRSPFFSRPSDDKKYLGDYFNEFGLNPQIEKILWFLGWPFDNFLALFDPQKSIAEVTNKDIINALPLILAPCGIRRGSLPGDPSCYVYEDSEVSCDTDKQQLKPYEHLLVVDMRKRKSQLVEEFKQYIENEYRIKSEAKKSSSYKSEKTYLLWEPIKDRNRKEAEIQLQVWKLRKQKNNYSEIGKQLNINEDTARKAFYKAFERSQVIKFDILKSQELLKDVELFPPTKNCSICPDKKTCIDLCPEVLNFLDREEKSTRETLFEGTFDQPDESITIADFDEEEIKVNEEPYQNDGGVFCPVCFDNEGKHEWIVQVCPRCQYINPNYRKGSI